MMQLNPGDLAFTKSLEGFRAHAYQDSAGVWTVGYGHTGPDVHPGLIVSEPYAEHLLACDMAHAVAAVNAGVKVPLNQSEFLALCDFAYNAGVNAFLHSTLLEDLNNGERAKAAEQFGLWVHAGGVVVPGLIKRRQAERDLFLSQAA